MLFLSIRIGKSWQKVRHIMQLVVSDIHSNLQALLALETWLQHTPEAKGIDSCVLLGDQVGYNANPVEVLEHLAQWPERFSLSTMIALMGNHESVILGQANRWDWAPHALQVLDQQAQMLPQDWKEEMARMPHSVFDQERKVMYTHGTPSIPAAFQYILNPYTARQEFQLCPEFHVCFFGHTHVPAGYRRTSDNKIVVLSPEEMRIPVHLDPESRWLINPGSLGQPRDNNPDLAFILFDQENLTVQWVRLPYEVRAQVESNEALGFPGQRLLLGK